MKRLLSGVTVLSLEQAVAAPFCTSKLADQGARVIKIERANVGDFARNYDKYARGSSSYFAWLNRGKESLIADIKEPKDKELLLDMIASKKVDVFVQNLAPGAAVRAGFGAEALRQLNDRLITLDISGYGDSGPRSDYKAYDLLVAAEAGLCAVTGTPEGPGRVGVSICDITCGMNGYAAILQGLYHREQTGKGSSYKVSLFDTIAEIMNVPYIQQKYTGNAPKRMGLSHPSIAPYSVFETRDKRSILIAIQNEREWLELCKHVLKDPGLATNPKFNSNTNRVAHRDELNTVIEQVFLHHDASSMTSLLKNANIAFGELNSVQGLVDHPQLRTVEYSTDIELTTISVPAPAVIPSPNNLGPVPKLGEHNEMIRAEFKRRRD